MGENARRVQKTAEAIQMVRNNEMCILAVLSDISISLAKIADKLDEEKTED